MARYLRGWPMTQQPGEEVFEGLGDIVSNLLALFILLTIIALTATVSTSTERAQTDGNLGETHGVYAWREADPITRPTAYVVVMGNGIGVLNFNAVIEAMAGRDRFTVQPVLTDCLFIGDCEEVEGVQVLTMREGPVTRYDLRIPIVEVPPYARLPEAEAPEVLAQIFERVPEGTVLTFFVYPDGLARFVPLYAALTESGRCFRWEPWEQVQPIRLVRGSLLGRRKCPI